MSEQMRIWDYTVVRFGANMEADVIHRGINEYGAFGWEMVAVVRDKYTDAKTVFMKRERPTK